MDIELRGSVYDLRSQDKLKWQRFALISLSNVYNITYSHPLCFPF